MSFHLTADSVRAGTKDVTRRRGWRNLKPNTVFEAVERYRGVRVKDRKSLGLFYVVSVRRERLDEIKPDDVRREGLNGCKTRADFVKRFCKAMRCKPSDEVTRIEFAPLKAREWP